MQVPKHKLKNSMEQQIESMLVKVMEENDTEYMQLSFSHDEDEKCEEERQTNQTETDLSKSNRLSFISTSEEPMSFQRQDRKFRNTFCLSSNLPNKFMPIMNPVNNHNYPMIYPSYAPIIQRSHNKKRTIESNPFIIQQLNLNPNLTMPLSPWVNQNQKQIILKQQLQPQPHQLQQQQQYQILQNQQQLHQQQQLKKRFNTTAFPQATNLKIEMIIHEITTLLTHTEKIDYFVFGKIKNNFVAILKTHKGSRMFQNYLKNTHIDIIHHLFVEIQPHINALMIDQYANYFCKRFFTVLNQKDRVDFLQSIKKDIFQLSLDSIGTYPLQVIIEEVGSKIEKSIIINEINQYLNEFCIDIYGTHVLEKIVSCFEEEFAICIYDHVMNNFISLATNANGICIVKKIMMLTHKKDLYFKAKVIIIQNARMLIEHPFGNHVLQIAIENWEESELSEILLLYKNSFTDLSLLRYSSNVIEKCIEKYEATLSEYVKEVCGNNRLGEVMKNHFGNYVIQKALKIISNGELKQLFVNAICNYIQDLGDRKIMNKWKTIVNPHITKVTYEVV